MAALISHAQNFEDVMLWRALRHVENGCYVDIGAQDPVVDSVSLLFHQHGWHGIHVEPVPEYAQALRDARPGDVVLQAAATGKPGTLRFFEIPRTGLGTPDAALAKKHGKAGFPVHEITVAAVTLDDVLAQAGGEIHWMKIDVEGGEKQALQGWKASPARPWIVVVESTLPLSQVQSHKPWERLVLAKGYRFAYFDGLNRFYVHERHPELRDAFASGPNVFDGFSIGEHSSSAMPLHLKERITALEAELDRVRNESGATLVARDAEHTRQWQVREGEFDKERQWLGNERVVLANRLDAAERAARDAVQALARREEQVNAREAARVASASRLAQALADRQRELEARVAAAHEEALAAQRRVAEREVELGAQLAAQRTEALQREAAVAERLGASQAESARVAQSLAALETQQRAMRESLEAQRQSLEAQRAESAATLAAREAEFAAKLAAREAEAAKVREVLAAREAEFIAQLRASQQEARDAYLRMMGRERDNEAQLRALREAVRLAELAKAEAEAAAHKHAAVLRREAREAALAHHAGEEALAIQVEALARDVERREEARASIALRLEGLRARERDAAEALAEALEGLREDLQAWRRGAAPPAQPKWSQVLADPDQPVPVATTLGALLALDGRAFVESAFLTLLHRRVDRTGLDYYLGRLHSGYAKLHLLGQIMDSREAKTAQASLEGLEAAVSAYRRGTLPLVGALFAGEEGADALSRRLRAVEQAVARMLRVTGARRGNADWALGTMIEINAEPVAGSGAGEQAPAQPTRMAEWPERTRTLYARLRREAEARDGEAA